MLYANVCLVYRVLLHLPNEFCLHVFLLYRSGRGVTPEFVIKQLIQPRFVLLVEETGNMNLRVGGNFVLKHFPSRIVVLYPM